MALAQTRMRSNYPSAQEGAANTVRISGRFTTAGASQPTVKSAGPFSVSAPASSVYTITLTEPCVEFLYIDASVWTGAGNANQVKVLLTPSIGDKSTPASFQIETQTVAGTAGNLTGPIVAFNVAYRKGGLANR